MTNEQEPCRSLAVPTTGPEDLKFKCDFCDVTFKSDLDVSRHLSSATHASSKNNFVSLQNVHDKNLEKQIPKNLFQLLQLVKLRSVRDIRDLTDKGYFELQNESLCGIADEFAKVLVKSLVEHEARNLPCNIRKAIMDALRDTDKSQRPADDHPSGTNHPSCVGQPPATQFVNRNENPTTVKQEMLREQPQRRPDQPQRRPDQSQNRPDIPTPYTPTPVRARNASTNQVNQPQPRVPTLSQAYQPHTRIPVPTQARVTTQPRISVQTRPAPAQPQANLPRAPNSSESLTKDGTPRQPVPRLDSDYVPRLGFIKSEPKDN